MDRSSLKQQLDMANIPTSWYSIYGERIPDRIVMEYCYKWNVFYFGERGKIDELASFSTEDEACNYLYNTLLRSKQKKDIRDKKNKENSFAINRNENSSMFVVSALGQIVKRDA
jgi:hypothetical protein